MKRYLDIERLKTKYANAFNKGDIISVSEKVDGANASFTYDRINKKVIAFSRNQQLSPENNLRGFYDWTQTLSKELINIVTESGNLIIFGEYLVPHAVKYPEIAYKKFYMFDVWDTFNEEFLPQNLVFEKFLQLKRFENSIKFAPILFKGEFTSWDDLMKLVGVTKLGAEPCGEGIVVKNQTTLNNKNSSTPYYIKIVSDKFSEVKKRKHKKDLNPETLKKFQEEKEITETIVTVRRTEKLLEKMIDEGIIPEDWDEKSMGIIFKNITKRMYEDCIKEEPETVEKVSNFGKVCAKVTMERVKEILKKI